MNEFLRNKRLEKGLFQREVAKKMGCSAQQIYSYEKGTRTPSLKAILKFAEVLEFDLEELKKVGERKWIK